MNSGRRLLLASSLTAGLSTLASRASAQSSQSWPAARPLSIVVAYAAGGGADAVARLIAPELGKRLGQQVIVDNKPGAGGQIGTAAVAKGPADGYALLLTPPGPIINSKLLYKSLPFDPDADLMPVTKLVESPFAVLVRKDFPARDLPELLAWVRANPGKLNVGTVGTGSTGHLLNLMIEDETRTKFNVVPYKGSSQVINDLAGGVLDMTIDYPSTYLGHIESGRVRPLGTLGMKRAELLPDVGTFVEAGFKGIEATGWFAMMVARGTPEPVVARLHATLAEVLALDDLRSRLRPLGYVPSVMDPAGTRALIERESSRLGAIVKAANLSLG